MTASPIAILDQWQDRRVSQPSWAGGADSCQVVGDKIDFSALKSQLGLCAVSVANHFFHVPTQDAVDEPDVVDG